LKYHDVESCEMKFHAIDDLIYPWDSTFYARLHFEAIRGRSVEKLAAFSPSTAQFANSLTPLGNSLV
jgi:hypothetical protein